MKIPILSSCLILTACTSNSPSDFFSNSFKKVDISNGLFISDTLGMFEYKIPDSSWMPIRVYDNTGNGLTVGDTTNGYFRGINVNQIKYTPPYDDESEHDIIMSKYNVLETGFMLIYNQKCRWHLINEFEDNHDYTSLFISYVDTLNSNLFVIHALVENAGDYKSRICSLENIIKSFRLRN